MPMNIGHSSEPPVSSVFLLMYLGGHYHVVLGSEPRDLSFLFVFFALIIDRCRQMHAVCHFSKVLPVDMDGKNITSPVPRRRVQLTLSCQGKKYKTIH